MYGFFFCVCRCRTLGILSDITMELTNTLWFVIVVRFVDFAMPAIYYVHHRTACLFVYLFSIFLVQTIQTNTSYIIHVETPKIIAKHFSSDESFSLQKEKEDINKLVRLKSEFGNCRRSILFVKKYIQDAVVYLINTYSLLLHKPNIQYKRTFSIVFC